MNLNNNSFTTSKDKPIDTLSGNKFALAKISPETGEFFNPDYKNKVTVHPSSDRRDIPVPSLESAGLENPAFRAPVAPVNGYKTRQFMGL